MNKFFSAVKRSSPKLHRHIDEVTKSGSIVETRVLREYGAVLIARNGVVPPNRIIFADEAEVSVFQAGVEKSAETIGGCLVELQATAMAALRSAISSAKSSRLSITPRGPGSARRGYAETVTLWHSRVHPALEHWVAEGKLAIKTADRIRSLSPREQIPEVLRLEEQGVYFAKDLSKSIMYSVAPPGTSQHLSMLALDVAEYDNKQIREILIRYGWFQTVVSDLPHFTYLGVGEPELPKLGLKKVTNSGQTFWVPDISG